MSKLAEFPSAKPSLWERFGFRCLNLVPNRFHEPLYPIFWPNPLELGGFVKTRDVLNGKADKLKDNIPESDPSPHE